MYKLTFTDEKGYIPDDSKRVTFKVNEKKRKVACIAYVTITNFHDFYDHSKERYNLDLDQYVLNRLKDYGIVNKKSTWLYETIIRVVGISMCDPNDEFNEDLGKHIAETRARRQVYDIMNLMNKFVAEYINYLSLRLEIAKEKTHFLKFREIDHERNLVRSTIYKDENSKAVG